MADMITDRYKILWTDGFNRETIAEQVVVEHLNEELAQKVLDYHRALITDNSDWYIMVRQDKSVWRGMEEFV